MNSIIKRWKISLLFSRRDTLDLKPAYQRGPAWTDSQKSLLVDSIFRGLEIPLIFIAGTSKNPNVRREVIDGQQRLRAIFEFFDGPRVKVSAEAVGRKSVENLSFRALSDKEKAFFLSRKLPICSLENATPAEKRLQFERLQLGQSLKPVELRNALASAVPVQIRNLAETHSFFEHAEIPDKRYKREDYLTHVLAYSYYSSRVVWRDIKAPALRKFIQLNSRGISQVDQQETEKTLSLMEELSKINRGIFKNK